MVFQCPNRSGQPTRSPAPARGVQDRVGNVQVRDLDVPPVCRERVGYKDCIVQL